MAQAIEEAGTEEQRLKEKIASLEKTCTAQLQAAMEARAENDHLKTVISHLTRRQHRLEDHIGALLRRMERANPSEE